MPLIKVATVGEIPEGGSIVVNVGGIAVSVWKIAGNFHAIANTCPHAEGPLNEGFIDEELVVTCPWHGWKFCVTDGKSPLIPSMSVPAYKVQVQGNDVFVEA